VATFSEITNALADLLNDNESSLVNGLAKGDIAIEAAMPHPRFGDQLAFVYREGVHDINYGVGELDGYGDWNISLFVMFSGSEETAADQLSKLAWNLLGLLADNTQTDHWRSLVVVRTTVDALLGRGGSWYIGERFTLRIRWTMTL